MFPSIKNPYKCTFDSKGKFISNLEVALERNQIHTSKQQRAPSERKSYIKQPPDFSYKIYLTPSKQLGQSKQMKKKKKKKNTIYEELHRIRSGLLVPVSGNNKSMEIITRFPRVGSYEAELKFVKMGKFKSSKYQDPKPYDYRQYEHVVPDFVTSYARDPLNLKFKSQCLSKVHGLHPVIEGKKGSSSKEKFITHKAQELKWDSKLFLSKEPWPTISGSFTRHRSEANAPSAFIDRVEETLSKLWLEEASKKQEESRRTAATRKWEVQNVSASPEMCADTQQPTGRQKEDRPTKILNSPSLSPGRHARKMPEELNLLSFIKPEPLGFFLPKGIVESVEELKPN